MPWETFLTFTEIASGTPPSSRTLVGGNPAGDLCVYEGRGRLTGGREDTVE
ncbi:hypothetical protein GCM10010293_01640 [Streptomyces griseoflavus]|nr:hypothetical protein GCM10010293_01640 [Streptomyces griseoflavus]